MPRLSITDLARPAAEYDPSFAPPCERTGHSFETKGAARREDSKRAACIRKACLVPSPPFNRGAALELADLLAQSGEGIDDHVSLASSVYMGQQRHRIGGALWKLHDACGGNTFTVRPRNWVFHPDELESVNPALLMDSLRSAVNRRHSGRKGGYLFAGLHGELNSRTKLLELHAHGVALGDHLAAIDQLRALPNFRARRSKGEGPARVVVGREALTNLPYPLLYTVQSYLPLRWRGIINGTERRGHTRHRIPEPFHSQVLLWLHSHSLEEVTLLMGLSVQRQGLVLAENVHQ